MSQPSRPRSRGSVQRRRRDIKFDQPVPLERRSLMAPIVATFPLTASFTASTAATVVNSDLGTVTVSENTTATNLNGMAPITSVSELTPVSSFGGQIVTIAAGPGGVFGEGVYAITRGPGDNTSAVNNPGVIYRVDPATGKASVFFDLNSVISQLDPGNATPSTPAANGLLTSTGLVNWYSITFDSEGVFSGTPAMFVSSVSRSDPSKNIIFEIAPNGTLMGVFAQFTDGLGSLNFNISPTAILVPPVQDQSFLSGLIGGSGISSVNGSFAALYFQSSSYSPGQTISNSILADGRQPDGTGRTRDRSGVQLNGNDCPDQRRHGPHRRPYRGKLRLFFASLFDLHRLRHARQGRDPGRAGLQRHSGLGWRALDWGRYHADRRPHWQPDRSTTSVLGPSAPSFAGSRA